MKVVQQETHDGKRLKFQVSTCQPIEIRFIPSRFTAELDLPGREKPAGVKPNRIVGCSFVFFSIFLQVNC